MRERNLTNKDFNFLHVICFDHVKKTNSGSVKIWKCQCRCGNIVYLSTYKITSGATRSCGCIRDDMTHKAENTTSTKPDSKGIFYEKKKRKYRVLFYRNKKQYHLGRFVKFEDAKIMRLMADTFTSMDNFLMWYSHRLETFNEIKNACYNENVDMLQMTEAIYDGCYEELYNNKGMMNAFIKDYSIGCQ